MHQKAMASHSLSIVANNRTVPLVSFVNGEIKESKKKALSIEAFQESKPARDAKRRKILLAESPKMNYQGMNFGPLAVKSGSSQLYVGALNKSTGEMQIYPAEIFNMHPVTHFEAEKEIISVETMTFQEKANLLKNAFGSGRQKRALQRQTKNKLAKHVVDSAVGTAMDIASTSTLHENPAMYVHSSSSAAIPPYNLNAKSPPEVYSLDSIIGPSELDSLKNVARAFFDCNHEIIADWKKENKYFFSVLSRLTLMPLAEEARWQRACCLMYLQMLLTFFNLKASDLRKKDPLPPEWPDMVKQLILNRFTVRPDGSRNNRSMPALQKELLLSHILVLCLIVDHFTLSLTLLQEDLKASARKLQMHARALGCKVKSEQSISSMGVKVTSYTAHLVVPLTFPVSKAKGKKSKT